jgi:hypothetical protein
MANKISVLEGANEMILDAGTASLTVRLSPSVRMMPSGVGTSVGGAVGLGSDVGELVAVGGIGVAVGIGAGATQAESKSEKRIMDKRVRRKDFIKCSPE